MRQGRRANLIVALVIAGVGAALLFLQPSESEDSVRQPILLFSNSSAVVIGAGFITIVSVLIVFREAIKILWQAEVNAVRGSALAEHHRFLRRLDHELKNPLTAIQVGLSTLAITPLSLEQGQIVRTVTHEARRLSTLVSSLRKLISLETTTLELQAVPVRELCQHIKALLYARTEGFDRQFAYHCTPEAESVPTLVCDCDLLLLAIHNVLDNAVKYTRPGDLITVRISEAEADLLIEVHDTGIGVPPAEHHLIWEELYRARNAVEVPGSGLGLSLVKVIIERHQGTVQLQSQASLGTVVTFRLPLT